MNVLEVGQENVTVKTDSCFAKCWNCAKWTMMIMSGMNKLGTTIKQRPVNFVAVKLILLSDGLSMKKLSKILDKDGPNLISHF